MDPSIDDIKFIASSIHRIEVLHALAENPSDRGALRSITGASSQTVGRVLSDFEERRWIERNRRTYELTPLGEFVIDRFAKLHGAMQTERKLRDVWEWLPREMEGFSVDLFADAVVSYPSPGYPYEPVERVTQLIEETDQLRGFGTTVLKSVNNEAVCRAVIEGMEFEYVYSPSALEATFSWDPEQVIEAASCENCTVFVHDDLPDGERCGLGITDNRVGICCNDADTRILRAVVDTGALKAREWAVSVYEHYRNEARVVENHSLEALVTDSTA